MGLTFLKCNAMFPIEVNNDKKFNNVIYCYILKIRGNKDGREERKGFESAVSVFQSLG